VWAGVGRGWRGPRTAHCPICGDHPTITALIDYEAFCGLPTRAHAPAATPPTVPEIDADEARRLVEGGAQLIDVREPWEWAISHIPGAVLIPMGDIPARTSEIDPNRPVVVHCAVGARSAKVVETLLRAGYTRVFNLAGGILEWANRQFPTESGGRR
jgi:adenylyltransferase/sulfurtransferase